MTPVRKKEMASLERLVHHRAPRFAEHPLPDLLFARQDSVPIPVRIKRLLRLEPLAELIQQRLVEHHSLLRVVVAVDEQLLHGTSVRALVARKHLVPDVGHELELGIYAVFRKIAGNQHAIDLGRIEVPERLLEHHRLALRMAVRPGLVGKRSGAVDVDVADDAQLQLRCAENIRCPSWRGRERPGHRQKSPARNGT